MKCHKKNKKDRRLRDMFVGWGASIGDFLDMYEEEIWGLLFALLIFAMAIFFVIFINKI